MSSLTFIHLDDPNIFLCSIGFQCGSIHETPQNSGISHLLEHIIFRSHNEIFMSHLEKTGIVYNGITGKDYTLYYAASAIKEAIPTLKIFQTITNSFKVSKTNFEKEKKIVLEELAMFGSSSNNIIKLIHKGTPYESSVIGTAKSIKNITFQEIEEFYNMHYKYPVTLVICHKKWENKIRKYANPPYTRSIPLLLDFNINRQLTPNEKILQTMCKHEKYDYCVIAYMGYPSSDPRNMMCQFIAFVLRKLLFYELRVKRALVYMVSCGYKSFLHTGYFMIKFNTNSGETEIMLNLIENVISKLKRDGITTESFNEALSAFNKRTKIAKNTGYIQLIQNEMLNILYNRNNDISTITIDKFKEMCQNIFASNRCAFIFNTRKYLPNRLKKLF